jgi:cobalt-zinc-cadmium resistance protein CzcA
MLNKIIEFSVRNKLIIGLFTAALIIFGVYETTKLPIDAVPDITNNQVQVITVAPALGATDIERLVTFPIEQASSNIAGIHEIRSFSRFGLSLVTIVFDDNIDVYWARQQVSERLQSVKDEIPDGVGTPELVLFLQDWAKFINMWFVQNRVLKTNMMLPNYARFKIGL